MRPGLYIFTLLICLLSKRTDAQADASHYSFKIEREKANPNKKKIPKSDSLSINFIYGYKQDIVSIKSNDQVFNSDTLNADNLYGLGGFMKLAKSHLRRPVDILFNGQIIKTIKFKRKYSFVIMEFDREKKIFTWPL